tara:strand:+ start:77 stop:793 length:717 start_codon:yes stop_codon:yes gene_type:complete
MLAHKQPKATDFCLGSVRKFYKDNKIIVFENGSNELRTICKKYNSEHVHQPINFSKNNRQSKYAAMTDLKDFKILLEQYKYVCDNCDSNWLIYLESDIVFRNKIEKLPEENIAGAGHMHEFNIFDSYVTDLINARRKENGIKTNENYNYCGCIAINKKILEKTIKKNWDNNINFFLKNCPRDKFLEIRCLDAFLSYLFLSEGYSLQDWDQFVEIYHSKNDEHRLVFAPIVHQFKHFYS